MSFPILVEFKVMTQCLKDLGASLDLVGKALKRIRRLKCFDLVPTAVGAYHATLLPNNGHVWTAHVHLVVEAADIVEDDDFDEWVAAVAVEFRRLTNHRGKFSVAPEALVDNPDRMARYICKPETCAPPPGELSPEQLDALTSGMHGRQLRIEWGSTARGRRFKLVA